MASIPNETDLSIELAAGGTIAVRGADNYDSLRGEGVDFIVCNGRIRKVSNGVISTVAGAGNADPGDNSPAVG